MFFGSGDCGIYRNGLECVTDRFRRIIKMNDKDKLTQRLVSIINESPGKFELRYDDPADLWPTGVYEFTFIVNESEHILRCNIAPNTTVERIRIYRNNIVLSSIPTNLIKPLEVYSACIARRKELEDENIADKHRKLFKILGMSECLTPN